MTQTFNIEKISTKTNLTTLKVNNFFLHSKYDPEKEAEQFAEKNYKENHLHILFGYGLGYFATALQSRFTDEDKLVIIDPLLRHFENIIELKKVTVIVDVDIKSLELEVQKIVANYNVNIKMICSPNYDKLFPDQYKVVLNSMKDMLRLNTLNRNTVNFFAEAWQENYVRNLNHVFSDNSLSKLEKRFNLPVIVASGGPSLTKQIAKLKEVRNKVILIASGSTINTLLYFNIEPDFVVSIDGSMNNYNHYKNHIFTNSYFIYSVRNHYKIREQFNKQAFVFIPSIEPDVQKHIEKITLKQLPMLVGGTSVANYALTIALYISSGKIALIGQDLAYTDNKTHAEHNKRFQNVDENYRKARGTFFTEGYNGEDVLTDYPFLSMKKNFEQIAKISNEESRLYNCTEGGVKIEGFKQETFNEFCADIKSPDTKIIIESNNENSDIQAFYQRVQEEVATYEKLIKLLEKALKLLNGNSNGYTFTSKVIKGLNVVDNEAKKIFEKVSMNSIVNPITLDVLNNFLAKHNESKKEEYERIFNQNKQLYSRLLGVTKLSKQYTENLIDEIKIKMEGEKCDGNK